MKKIKNKKINLGDGGGEGRPSRSFQILLEPVGTGRGPGSLWAWQALAAQTLLLIQLFKDSKRQ